MSSLARSALVSGLQLSLGRPVTAETARWNEIFARCVEERCAALAWLRSEQQIRAQAPVAVTEAWASFVRAHRQRVDTHIRIAREAVDWLAAHGVQATLLKGFPLSLRLYGCEWARQINDIDLHVDAPGTAAASNALTAVGWRHLRGHPPLDVEFVKAIGGDMLMLELHSVLAGPWHASLPFPAVESAHIAGTRAVRAHAGAFVPAYLASHLLQHADRPMLWLVDFLTLWDSASASEREDAGAAARRARLGGALATVQSWLTTVRQAAEGDEAAAMHLEKELLRPGSARTVVQLLRSADTVPDALRVVLEVLRPRESVANGTLLELWKHRLAAPFRSRAQAPSLS